MKDNTVDALPQTGVEATPVKTLTQIGERGNRKKKEKKKSGKTGLATKETQRRAGDIDSLRRAHSPYRPNRRLSSSRPANRQTFLGLPSPRHQDVGPQPSAAAAAQGPRDAHYDDHLRG